MYNNYETPNVMGMNQVDQSFLHLVTQLQNQSVVVQTVPGTLRGNLVEVTDSYITLLVSGNYYFIRLSEINWIMPTNSKK
ncbi:DUF2642 domain-containing protein [Halalkalibacillus halophilus]|uniref:DUF2642 domain-containing protein n=1 Tax=Halalkalibacillus halophilus TaxID=392827 RepID=UPI000425982E|nr:DUF2642 domain-containing protein [Halalkalibacillus halophilus]